MKTGISSAVAVFARPPLTAVLGFLLVFLQVGTASAAPGGCEVRPSGCGSSTGSGSSGAGFSQGILKSFVSPANDPVGALVKGADGNYYGTAFGGGPGGNGTIFRMASTSDHTVTTLHAFSGADGTAPDAALVLASDGALYGTALVGGTQNAGTIFRITQAGTFTLLRSMATAEGSDLRSALVQNPADGLLYGTAHLGGANGKGSVFKISTAGAFTLLHSFTGGTGGGESPRAGVIRASDGNFYGTTEFGGSNNAGTVFRVTPAGTFTLLHSFVTTDGSDPRSALVQASDGNLWGTTFTGGANGFGTVFKMTTAGVLTTVYHFTGTDGSGPRAAPIQAADGKLYGTTSTGGASGKGTVYSVTLAGTFTSLVSLDSSLGARPIAGVLEDSANPGTFYGATADAGTANGGTLFKVVVSGSLVGTSVAHTFGGDVADGAYPAAGLKRGPDGLFYGTTRFGGSNNFGTVFRLNANGTLTTLHAFNNSDGAFPIGGVVFDSAGNLYGATANGGASLLGTVFRISAAGAFASLYSFSGSDGSFAASALLVGSDGNLYGTTATGGANNLGTIFKVTTPAGTPTLTTLRSLAIADGDFPYSAALVEGADGNLYGTTEGGGTNGVGVVFRISKTGTGFAVLHSFTDNPDGAYPDAALVLAADGNFYGTTYGGGANNTGTLFRINPSNSAYAVLHSFSDSEGANPFAALIQATDGNFYGTTQNGGSNGSGTAFRFTPGSGAVSLVQNFGGQSGEGPRAALVQDTDGSFLGTTESGGSADAGVVFRISPVVTSSDGGGGGGVVNPIVVLFALGRVLLRRRRG